MLPQIVPGADTDMANQLQRLMEKQGIKVYLQAKVTGANDAGVTFEHEGKQLVEPAETILVAVGRKPYTDGLGAKEVGVAFDARNRIIVDGQLKTNVPGIYAIGDVIPGPMLAHKAEEEGIAAVETIAGKHGHVNYNVIPGVVYTAPELAWVGQTEQQLEAAKIPYNTGKFRFTVNGRALAMDEAEGQVKILAAQGSGKILGVHILGPQGSALIAEAAIVMEFGGSAEDIARTCHAHPTLPEVVKEAAMAVSKRAIHG
jgi:dihydrolipoamide dehydrogenase